MKRSIVAVAVSAPAAGLIIAAVWFAALMWWWWRSSAPQPDEDKAMQRVRFNLDQLGGAIDEIQP